MKKLIFSICTMFALVTILSGGTSYAQTNEPVRMTGKTVAAGRGDNPNIKSDNETEAPKLKSKTTSCSVTVENKTGNPVKVYVDGYYRGILDAYGKATIVVNNGYKTVYCVNMAGTKEWSGSSNCTDSSNYFTVE